MCRSARALVLMLFAPIVACRAAVVEPTLQPAWSEDEARDPLSRSECVALAVRSAPSAAAWTARIQAARASLEQAQLLPNPSVSLGWEDLGLDSATAGIPVQTTLSLALALQDACSRSRRTFAARYELEAEEADVRAEIARLAAGVSRAYDGLIAVRQRAALAEELAAVARRQCDDVAKFVASGVLPHVEFERSDAELAQSRAQVAQAEADARLLELEFAFALGFERPLTLRLADALTDAGDATSLDLATLLASAVAARSELSAAKARYAAELERLKLSAERLQFLPTIGAGARTQDGELSGVASIDVELPIFDAGSAAERAQDASLLAAAADMRTAGHEVAREVCAALERLSAAEAYLAEHARDLARRRRTLRERTETLFRAGEVEYSELALARRDEVEARIALVDAELVVAAARVDLDAASGELEARYAKR